MNTADVLALTPRLWTREEYYKADTGVFHPEERVELIGGRIVTMSPQNSPYATCLILVSDVLRAMSYGSNSP
jgi:Uma2 family endonuclease